MSTTVDGMEAAFQSMDAAKISKVMDRFEAACTEMDIKTAVMGYVAVLNLLHRFGRLTTSPVMSLTGPTRPPFLRNPSKISFNR